MHTADGMRRKKGLHCFQHQALKHNLNYIAALSSITDISQQDQSI